MEPRNIGLVYVNTAQDLIYRDEKQSNDFNANHGIFVPQCLKVESCKHLGLKIDDQQLRI